MSTICLIIEPTVKRNKKIPKYQPLKDFLFKTPQNPNGITLSFVRISQIIGSALPNSAYNYPAWWANQTDTTNRPQARAWTDAGFKVVKVDWSARSVMFKRVYLNTNPLHPYNTNPLHP